MLKRQGRSKTKSMGSPKMRIKNMKIFSNKKDPNYSIKFFSLVLMDTFDYPNFITYAATITNHWFYWFLISSLYVLTKRNKHVNLLVLFVYKKHTHPSSSLGWLFVWLSRTPWGKHWHLLYPPLEGCMTVLHATTSRPLAPVCLPVSKSVD